MTDNQQSTSSSTQGTSNSVANSGVDIQVLKNQFSNKFQNNKSLVLKIHSILSWEQDAHPFIVVGAVSVAFLVIYLLNSSLLTTVSYIGIFAALTDLALPTITKNLTKSQSKQAVDVAKYDKICHDAARVVAFLNGACDWCCSLKAKKPKVYYPALLVSLLALAFIGSRVNNLLLTYFISVFILSYPGLDRKGVPQKIVDIVYQKFSSLRPPQVGGSFAPSSVGGDTGRKSSSGKRN